MVEILRISSFLTVFFYRRFLPLDVGNYAFGAENDASSSNLPIPLFKPKGLSHILHLRQPLLLYSPRFSFCEGILIKKRPTSDRRRSYLSRVREKTATVTKTPKLSTTRFCGRSAVLLPEGVVTYVELGRKRRLFPKYTLFGASVTAWCYALRSFKQRAAEEQSAHSPL